MLQTAEDIRPTEEFRPLTDNELDGVSGGSIAKNTSSIARGLVGTAGDIGITIIVFLEITAKYQKDPWYRP